MDYSTLSDFEINKRVAKVCNSGWDSIIPNDDGSVTVDYISGHESFNYCHNPADAWSIIVENNIGIDPYPDDGWVAHAYSEIVYCESKIIENPLRAAMIVYLMMQEGE